MALSVGVAAACGKKDKNQPGDDKPGVTPPPATGGDYTVDTTEYYLGGNGAGDLGKNNWSNTNHTLVMVRDESADHNVFKITINMYADDAFQILHDDSWDGQMGIEYFLDVTDEGADAYSNSQGVVKNDAGTVVFYGAGLKGSDVTLEKGHDGVYTFSLHTFPDGEKDPYITYTKDAELKALMDMYVVSDMNDFGFKQAQYLDSHMNKTSNGWKRIVKIEESDLKRDADGKIVKEGAQYVAIAVRNDVADDTGYKAVTCDDTRTPVAYIEGDKYNLLPAGIYTFIYNPETDTLTIVDGAFELYFVGSFNGWADGATEKYMLTEGADGNWTGMLTITEEDYVEGKNYAEAKLYNPLGDGWYSPDGNNMQLVAGEYFFKFTTAESKVEYEKLAYYLIGTFVDGEGKAQNFTIVNGLTPALTINDDGTATIDYEISDVTGNSSYGWIKDEGGADAIFALKVGYGTALGGVNGYYGIGKDGGDNYFVTTAGEYTITYNPETKSITVAPTLHEKTVTFDLNYEGATGAPEAQTITEGEKATAPAEPTRTDYTFYGWYTDEACTKKYDFDTPVKADITLYARWILTASIPASVKVTFDLNYEGAPEATEADTVKGLVAQPADPEREGYYFLGWYSAAADGELVNFDALVSEPTTVYAHWVFQYHIVGSLPKNEVLGDYGWKPENYSLSLALVADSEHPWGTYFTITLLLYAGDEFKIIGPGDWSGYDAGAGCLRGGNGELGGDNNIVVNASGTYTLYFSTNGAWEITWTFVELPPAIVFSVNGQEGNSLIEKDGVFVGTVLVRDGATVKIIDKNDDNKEYAVNITADGDYIVTFNPEDGTVSVVEIEYYIAGTLVIDGANVNFSIAANSPKLTYKDGAYSIDLEVTDVTSVDGYGWISGGIFACKVVTGTVGNVSNWNNDANGKVAENDYVVWAGENLVFKTAGTYTITFDTVTRTVSVTPKAA